MKETSKAGDSGAQGDGGTRARHFVRLLAEADDRHGVALRRWTMMHGGSSAEAADLVQEAFERALRTRPALTTHDELRAWLLLVIRRLFIDARRSMWWRGWASADLDHHPVPPPEVIPRWRQVDVAEALFRIAPHMREVVELKVSGRSLQQIADQLDIPIATVSTRLFRARQQLRRLLTADAGSVSDGTAVPRDYSTRPGRRAVLRVAVRSSADAWVSGPSAGC